MVLGKAALEANIGEIAAPGTPLGGLTAPPRTPNCYELRNNPCAILLHEKLWSSFYTIIRTLILSVLYL